MLKRYPTLKYILSRAVWYFITFLAAVTINFFLPRLGTSNPVDIIMARVGAGLDTEAAKEKEESYLKEFGLVKLIKAKHHSDASGKPVRTTKLKQIINYISMHEGRSWTSFLINPRRILKSSVCHFPGHSHFNPYHYFVLIIGNDLELCSLSQGNFLIKCIIPLASPFSAIPIFRF
jgi:peptide/nickel transport system permease protein